MKKMTFFVMALAMVLGFTQCKKEQVATTEIEGEKVTITLKLDNGSRGHIEPNENTAAVVYDNGDIIMVGFNGAYVGDLTTTDGSNFSGSVDISGEPADGKIHFYYLNGKNQTVNSGKCTVDISDQTTGLPVISYASVAYRSDNTYSNVKMRNQCGLVKFNTTNVAGAITISGMNNQMEVDFTAQSFTPKNIGDVKLNGTSGTTRWAILLPQDAVDDATVIASGYNNSTCDVPSVTNNLYYTAGVSVSLTPAFLDGLFTVNADGKKVYFSKGNLQATTTNKGTTWTWAFAEHQWDKIGNAAANTTITGNKTVSTTGTCTVDLFGWSTDETYLGINKTNNNNGEYEGGFKDWGKNADVIAGIGSDWYTLSGDEWYYLFITRTTTSNLRFCKAKVGDCFGVILLPDDWSASYYTLVNCNETSARNFDDNNIHNKISLSDWTSKFEANGAVFLPCAGQRNSGNVVNAPNGQVHYWSASKGNADTGTNANANHVRADGNGVAANTGAGRSNGFSVRLVRDAN